jgi:hypothetical protein
MKKSRSVLRNSSSRRLFLRNGMIAAGAATMGPGLLPGSLAAFGRDDADHKPVRKEILPFCDSSRRWKR